VVAEVFAGMGAIKTAFDIAKGLKDIDDATRRNAAVIELQEKILSAQSAQMELVQTIGELKKRVADLEAWDTEKKRYELKAVAPGSFAYVLKPEAQGSEPPHQICAACYANHKPSILQIMPRSHVSMQLGFTKYHCPECKSEIVV